MLSLCFMQKLVSVILAIDIIVNTIDCSKVVSISYIKI